MSSQQQQRRMSSQPTLVASSAEQLDVASKQHEQGKENRRSPFGIDEPQGRLTREEPNEEEDEDNQVIPSWPSKQEQLARNASSEFIQHKVYSLKDYSQVASPTAISSSSGASSSFQQQQQTAIGGAGKLLKSMSQDRKVKPSNKRMSECIYPVSQMSASQSLFGSGAGAAASGDASSQGGSRALSPPDSSLTSAGPSLVVGQTSSASFSVGQGSNINSLLPAANRAAQGLSAGGPNQPSLIVGESRIDRMRKLFVSPLSLRSSASGGSSTSHSVATTAPADTSTPNSTCSNLKQREPRLSIQATGSGYKPGTAAHHLMHAMHRSTGGPTTTAAGLAQAMMAHHSRRSPMRQKQAKGFRVYGCPLQMANNIYPITCFGRADIYKQQAVPYVLARLCNYIEENSSQLTHEGIFRVSGNARLMEKLRTLFDHLGDAPLESESVDVATSASMLKMYLRELPEPLIPTRMNYYFIALAKKYAPYLSREQASSTSHALQQQQKYHALQKSKQQASNAAGAATSSSTTSVSTGAEESVGPNSGNANNSQYVRQRLAFSRDLTKLIRKLPIENYNLLKYLACFLYRISLKQQYNKMCAEALGIVFGPNVFRIRSESYKGLKEQELSNQIMASIISNYKLIFDSELTDPLGNVVDGSESVLVAAGETLEQQKRKQQPAVSVSAETSQAEIPSTASDTDLLAQAERLAQRAHSMQASLIPLLPVVAQSASIVELPGSTEESNDTRDTCCPGRCNDFMYGPRNRKMGQPPGSKANRPINDDNNDDDVNDCDDEEDDEDDEDEDEDEEESYTPSSGSGSYCSSMDSQTLESSYDGEGEVEGKRAARLPGDLTSRSTSECASDTSYTPTSSHTDSDGHDDEVDESFDDQRTSSRGSSVSIGNRLVESQSTGDATMPAGSQGARSDCRVCKRRESLQISNLATGKGSNGCSRTTLIDATTDHAAVTDENQRQAGSQGVLQSFAPLETSLSDTPLGQRQSSSRQRRTSGARISRRRRQVTGVRITDETGGKIRKSPIASITGSTTNGTQSDSCAQVLQSSDRLTDMEHVFQPRGSRQHARHSSGSGSSRAAPRSANPLFRRRSSSASSLNGQGHRLILPTGAHYHHGQRASSHQRRLMALLNQDSGGDTARHRTKLATGVAGSRKSKNISRRQQEHHAWDSRKQSRHSMRARNVVKKASDIAAGSVRPATGSTSGFVVACDLDLPEVAETASESISLGTWSEIFTKHLADEAACATANYEEPDSPARYFLMRSFNSDETLLRSLSYCMEWPSGSQSNVPEAQVETEFDDGGVGQQKPVAASQRRRHSNLDFIDVKPTRSLLPLVCKPCEQIFEALDLAEETESPISGCERLDIDEGQQNDDGQSGARKLFGTSTISLIDNRIDFRKSGLSMTNLDQQSDLSRPHQRHTGCDAILVQMMATRELIKTMKKMLKLGRNSGFSKEIEQLLLKFANSEEGTNSVCQSGIQLADTAAAYSDDCLACYVDHLSARGFIEELNQAMKGRDMQASGSNNSVDAITGSNTERLCKVLTVKITLFKQRYNDLKNIRDHYVRHHAHGAALIATLNSLSARHRNQGREAGGRGHGSLDTLKMQQQHPDQQQVLSDDAATSGHRSRILSVPNRELLANSSGGTRSRSAMTNKNLDLRENLFETSVSGNEDATSNSAEFNRADGGCKFGSLCPVEFVFNIEKQLALKRQLGNRVIKLNQMTTDQLQSEKLELQKNLLRYEHWFGRPVTRLEFSLTGHLYERYRAVKVIKQRKTQQQSTSVSDLRPE